MKFLVLFVVCMLLVVSVPVLAQDDAPVTWHMTVANSVNGAAGPKEAPEEPGPRGNKGQPDRAFPVEFVLLDADGVTYGGVVDFSETMTVTVPVSGTWALFATLPDGTVLEAQGEAELGDAEFCHVKRAAKKTVELKCAAVLPEE